MASEQIPCRTIFHWPLTRLHMPLLQSCGWNRDSPKYSREPRPISIDIYVVVEHRKTLHDFSLGEKWILVYQTLRPLRILRGVGSSWRGDFKQNARASLHAKTHANIRIVAVVFQANCFKIQPPNIYGDARTAAGIRAFSARAPLPDNVRSACTCSCCRNSRWLGKESHCIDI